MSKMLSEKELARWREQYKNAGRPCLCAELLDHIDAQAEQLKKAEAKVADLARRNRIGAADIDKQRLARVELKALCDAQAKQLKKATEERNIFRDELVGSEAELAEAEKRIAALEKAVKPFAALWAAAPWNRPPVPKDDYPVWAVNGAILRVGDFRKVAALDQKGEPDV